MQRPGPRKAGILSGSDGPVWRLAATCAVGAVADRPLRDAGNRASAGRSG